jgi:hypothetical protein
MKSLKKQLQDYLKGYMVDAEHFSIEDFKMEEIKRMSANEEIRRAFKRILSRLEVFQTK